MRHVPALRKRTLLQVTLVFLGAKQRPLSIHNLRSTCFYFEELWANGQKNNPLDRPPFDLSIHLTKCGYPISFLGGSTLASADDHPETPERVNRPAEARAQFGDLLDRLLPWLWVEDPLADAFIADIGHDLSTGWRLLELALARGIDAVSDAPDSLKALFRSLDDVPLWVDFQRVDQAGGLLFRTGPLGGIVLGARSLVYGYAAPAGNKPLMLSGRLTHDSTGRLAETSRFVYEVCKPGGLSRFGEGFKITVRVRLMHSRVRWLIHQGDDWQAAQWGLPINQHDMLATSLLFSQVWLDGVRRFGFAISRQEAEDWLHLWRWCSVVMGVDAQLLPTTEPEAQRVAELIRVTQQAPDAHSQALVQSLISAAHQDSPQFSKMAWGFMRGLIEPDLADGLGAPNTLLRFAVPGLRQWVRPIDRIARRSRRLSHLMTTLGERPHWTEAIKAGLPPGYPTFQPAERLKGQL